MHKQMGWPGAHADGFQIVGSWGNTQQALRKGSALSRNVLGESKAELPVSRVRPWDRGDACAGPGEESASARDEEQTQ